MDDLGSELVHRLDERGGIESAGALEAAMLLKTLLFDEMSFMVADDTTYMYVGNWSIERALHSRKGAPITVAVIFKCILSRAGVQVDIIALESRLHPLLGFASIRQCVDMFCNAEQFQAFEWNLELVSPLSYTEVLEALAVCIMRCYEEAASRTPTTRVYVDIVKASILCTAANSREPAYFLPFAIYQTTSYMDPETFRYFGLIDDDTMRRHLGAPFLNSLNLWQRLLRRLR